MMSGKRVDYHHRLTFQVLDDIIVFRKVGSHDVLKRPWLTTTMVFDIDGRPLLSPHLARNDRRSGTDPDRHPLATIDDCITLAHQLVDQLNELGKRKYPLDLRKGVALKQGRKGVENMVDAVVSKTVKASGRTYFFDVKRTKEGQPYLVITESRFQGEGKEHERVRLMVFPEHAQEFAQSVVDMLPKLARPKG
jgi:hypothetical protein